MVGVLTAAVAYACGPADVEHGPGFRVDTLGNIVVARNGPPTGADTLVAVLTIGPTSSSSDSGPGVFGRVNSVALDGEGRVYIADGIASAVSVFEPEGEFVRKLGRPGSGPGEFGNLYSLTFVGDSLLALDPGNARVSVFSPDGHPADTWRWLPITGPVNHVRFYPVGPREAYVLGIRTDQARRGLAHIRFTPSGPTDTVLHMPPEPPADAMLRCPRPDGGVAFFPVPFSDRRIAVPAPGGHLASAFADSYRIALQTSSGDTVSVIERDYEPLAVSDDEWATATDEYRQFQRKWPGVTCTPEAMERAAHQPALQGVFFAYEGDLVVEVTTEKMTRYDFFDANGRAGETVILPLRDPSVAPYFRGSRLVQVEKDSLDIQHVRMYQRRGGSR